MQVLFVYLLKSCVYSGILFLYYFIALRNKQFHYYNRFYLLMSVAVSLLLPFVNIEIWQLKSGSPQVIQLMNVILVNGGEASTTGNHFTFSPETVAFILLCAVAFYLLVLLAINITKIVRLGKTFPAEFIGGIRFLNTNLSQAPFSFFSNLFWKDTLDVNSDTGRQILRLEMAHIQQKHSCDKVFMRTVTAVFWFNPFFWMMQKELSMIHEFIADEEAIDDNSAETFAIMLLESQYSKAIFSPAQSFSYSPIKRRLLMLTTSQKPSFSYARRMAVLPLLAATILLFAFRLQKGENDSAAHVNAPFVLVVDAGHGGDDDGAIGANDVLEKNVNLTIAKKIVQLAPGYGITVSMTRKEDQTVALPHRMNFIESHHPNATISIHVNTTTEQTTDKNEVNIFVSRNENNSNYLQSRMLGSGLLQAIKSDFAVNDVLMQRKQMGIYIIDQNPYPAVIVECGYMNNKESITGLQSDATITKMANDILAGVVAYANAIKDGLPSADEKDTIPTVKKVPVEQNSQGKTAADTAKMNPIYFVDGKEKSSADIAKIDVNTVQTVQVYKGEKAMEKYGEKGKNGVVEIVLKTAANTQSTIYVEPAAGDTSGNISASFPGGIAAWSSYLRRQLNNDIVSKGPPGTYTVGVSFYVDENGNISKLKALNDAGYGTAQEAIRVIERGPKWKPAKKDGKPVGSTMQQSITWKRV